MKSCFTLARTWNKRVYSGLPENETLKAVTFLCIIRPSYFEVVCRKMFDHWFAPQYSHETTNLTKLNWRFECFCEVGYITRKESQDPKMATRWYQGNCEESEWRTLLWHIKESTTSEHSSYHASVCLCESCSQSMWTYGDFSAHITCDRRNDETNPKEIG